MKESCSALYKECKEGIVQLKTIPSLFQNLSHTAMTIKALSNALRSSSPTA